MTPRQRINRWYRFARRHALKLALLTVVSGVLFVIFPSQSSAVTTVPTKMNFQGRLTDSSGNVKVNGTYNMRLRLYTVSSGGSAVWSEDRLVSASQGVTVTNGLFSIKLGEVTSLPASLFASGELYFAVELPSPATATSASPSWTEGPMTPRNQMATSAYAYNSETLDGLDSVDFGQLVANNTWTGVNLFKNASDGTAAFEVQTSSSVTVLKVDTTTSQVSVANLVATSAGSRTTSQVGNAISETGDRVEGDSGGIAIASDGFARVTYHEDWDYELRFVQCTDTDCSPAGAGQVTVDANNAGNHSSLKLGSDGYGRIAYEGNGSLKFATCLDDGCFDKNLTTIDDGGVGVSLALGSDGFARISHYDWVTNDLKFVQCTNASCSTKNLTTVDSSVDVGSATSLALGSDGFARISYYDSTNGDLEFVQCTNAACTTKNTTTVDSTGSVGDSPSLALGSDGFARISYTDSTNGDLEFAQCTNADCSTKNLTTVDSASTVGDYTSLALGSDGFARISYRDGGNFDLEFAQCTNASCSTKNLATLDASGDVYDYSALTLGSDGFARVIYPEDRTKHLRYIRLTNDSGGETVSGSSLGGTTSFGVLKASSATLGGSVSIENSNSPHAAVKIVGGKDFITARGDTGGKFSVGEAGLNLGFAAGGSFDVTERELSWYGADGGNTYLDIDEDGLDIGISDPGALYGQSLYYGGDSGDALYVSSDGTSSRGIVLESSSSGDLMSLTNNSNEVLRVGATGVAILKNSSDSTSAFTVQNAGATDIFTVDTSNSRVQIGEATSDATGALLVLDGKNTTGDPTGIAGAMYYNSDAGKFRCYQAGAWTDCIGGGGGATSVGSLDGGTANATGATISGSTLYLQSASGTNPGLVNTATQTFAGNKTFNGSLSINDVSVAAGKSVTIVGGNTASRPASPTEGMIYYDTTTKQLLTYANGKWQADRTEAVIVAASNSSQADKDAADYVADGNTGAAADGDQVQVNAALTAASGRKVVLLAGTYVADATILIPNNTTFAGVGQGTVVELADLDAVDNLIENSDTTTGTGVTIQDMKLDGRSDLNTAGSQSGVYMYGMGAGSGSTARQGTKISNVTAVRFRTTGFSFDLSSNNILIKNTSQGNNYGIYFYDVSSNNVINGNIAQGNTTGGIYLNNTDYSSVTGNTMQGNGNTGLTLTNFAIGNTVTGNVAQGNAQGIAVGSSSNHNTVTGNTVSGNTAYGIIFDTVSFNTASANYIYDSGGSTTNNGIYLTISDSNTVTSNSIRDTSATTNNYAINVFNSTSDTNYLANNTLGGGSINDAGTGTVYGGQVNSSGNYVVQPAGTIELMKNTNVTGTLTVTSNIDTNGSLTVGTADQFVISNAGVVTAGTWQGSAIQDTYVADNLTISGSGTVDWAALNNYPAACAAGSAITQLEDSVTCAAFAVATGGAGYIQNQNAGAQTANFWVSGNGHVGGDAAVDGQLTVGNGVFSSGSSELEHLNLTGDFSAEGTSTFGTGTFNGAVTVAASQSLRIVGGNTASRPASPTEGMIYYDTTTKQLLTYSNGKWQADRSTSTKIVAASNSSQAIKDAADYVADGDGGGANDGDQVQINSALTAAAGGKVYLAEGTYTLDASVTMPNNTILAGAGKGTQIRINSTDTIDMIVNTDTTTGTGIAIQDLSLNSTQGSIVDQRGIYFINIGQTGGSRRDGARLSNLWLNDLYEGIILQGTKLTQLAGVSVVGGEIGIQLSSASSNSVTQSSVENANSGIVLVSSASNTVSGNTVTGGQTGISSIGVASTGNAINANTIDSPSSYGIFLQNASKTTITANNISAPASRAIQLQYANNNVVSSNVLTNSGGSTDNNAIYLDDSDQNTITSNSITDSSATTTNYAINVSNSTSGTNYVADNILGTSTVNDLGTGTVYANQLDGSGQFVNRSTGGFAIQGTAGTNLLSTAGTASVTIGTSDTTGTVFVLDTKTGAGDPTGILGGMYYNSNAGEFRCYQVSAWKNCDDGGNATTLDGLDSTAFGQLSASNTWTGANTFNVLGTNAFDIQNGSSVSVLKVDTVSQTISVGNSTNTNSARLSVEGTGGVTWIARSAAEANSWQSVTYGNGLFVAVSQDGTNRVMTSPDGITWTVRTAAQANLWKSVTYGNGLFVAVSQDGTNRVMTSPDGITWTVRTAAQANSWRSVTYANGLFVAVSDSGTNRVMTSGDGITWTARTAAQANEWQSVTYGGGRFVAVSSTGTNRVMTSTDGITWTARTAAQANSWWSVTYGNGQFVAASTDGTNRVMTSPDGITWTARTAAEANSWNTVTYGNGQFVAVSNTGTNRVMTSSDVALGVQGQVQINGGFAVGSGLFSVDNKNAGTVTILGNNSGETGAWQVEPDAMTGHWASAAVTANGYVYVAGEFGSAAVNYAKLNADGTLGTWQSANSLPAARHGLELVTANGYIYALGGNNTTAAQSTVYYAKLNADGSVGAWQTEATNPLPQAREFFTSVVANGYVYVMGGDNGGEQSTIYYAKLNANGSVGAWQTEATNPLPQARHGHTSVLANGYVYILGGIGGGGVNTTVYYAQLNTNGSVGAWQTSANAMSDERYYATSVVSGGYVYVMGGFDGSDVTQSDVRYAKLNANGSIGSWSTSGNTLPAARQGASSVVANGYAYLFSGSNGGTQTTVYYTRLGGTLNVGGNLDLVGLQGQTLADGGEASTGSTGGSITAGNIVGVGTLQMQGEAMFASSASVTGNFTAGNGIFAVDTGSNTVRIGSSVADATGVVLVLDTKNTSGDPTGVEGAMYYNSSSKSFRCYMNGRWRSCVSGVVFANTAVPAAVTNTTTETNFAQNYSIPADDCQPGRVFRVTAQGVYSIPVTTNPSITIRVKAGTTVLGTTGAQALGTTALTNRQWRVEFQFICTTTGVSGTVEAGGLFTRHTSAIASVMWEMNNTAPITVNTTSAQTLQISAQWSAAAAANTITLRQLIVEESGP